MPVSARKMRWSVRALAQLGVRVSELRDQPWGERNFHFDDPDGYVWAYGQPRR
jgi:uncharacterized glyoxalase superfamily protein PhnB